MSLSLDVKVLSEKASAWPFLSVSFFSISCTKLVLDYSPLLFLSKCVFVALDDYDSPLLLHFFFFLCVFCEGAGRGGVAERGGEGSVQDLPRRRGKGGGHRLLR